MGYNKSYKRKSPLWRVKNPKAYRKWRKGYDKRWRKKNIKRLAPIWCEQERARIYRRKGREVPSLPRCQTCRALLLYSYREQPARTFCGDICEWNYYWTHAGEMPRREHPAWKNRVEREIDRMKWMGEL